MLAHLSELSILVAVALWLSLEVSLANGQLQYRLTPFRAGRPMKQPQLKSGPECPTPYFPNGVAKLRQRNRMVRFTCASGFTLVGNMYSMCEKGRWDTPIPYCIRAGCPDVDLVDNGQISYEYGQAAVMLFCSSGYQVAGPSKAYCNGTHWDRPLGNCRNTGIGAATSCDFEAPDLCGWMNEATHDFDWKRSDGIVSPKALKTGPKFDHTTGTSLAGHFMMVDSVEQFTNETARLLSPVYPANYSTNACFWFYYHMYGDAVGMLSVYVRPMSQPLDNIRSQDASFVLKGNQRNMWNEGYFDLKQYEEEFQIVIEASIGMKAKSDIAIDDVALMNDDDCRPKSDLDGDKVTAEMMPSEVPDDQVFKLGSCENRCGVNTSSVITIPDTSVNFVQCDCFEGCVDRKTCCPDYGERCVFNETVFTSSTAITTSTKILTSTTETTRSTTTPLTSTSTTTIRTTQSTTKPTTTRSTATQPTTTSTSTVRPSTSSTARTTLSSTVKTTKFSLPTTTTTKSYNLRPRTSTTSTTAKPIIVPMVRTRKPTTTSTTTAPTQTTEEVVLKLMARFDDVSETELSSTMLELGDTKPNLARIILFSGIGMVLFGAVVLLIVVHIRRNSGANVLNRLKQKSMKNNFGSKEGFEDVRFLAADEHLDFSIPDDEADEAVDDSNGNDDVVKNSSKGKK